jgi:hypothetical protein
VKPLIPIPHFDNIPPYENMEALCELLDNILGQSYKEAAGLNKESNPPAKPGDSQRLTIPGV